MLTHRHTQTHQERMDRFVRAGLYLVTSQVMSGGRKTVDVVKAALAGGVRLVQLREKDLPAKALFRLAVELRGITAQAGALLIINDRLDVALAAGADGVHLGQEDLPVKDARRIAPDLIIGASSHDHAEALAAEREGASYVNIGPVFPTGTKKWDKEFLGIDAIKSISQGIEIPFTVMGGIKKEHILPLRAAGAKTIAVVTAVTGAPDPRAAAAELLSRIGQQQL